MWGGLLTGSLWTPNSQNTGSTPVRSNTVRVTVTTMSCIGENPRRCRSESWQTPFVTYMTRYVLLKNS